MSLVQNWTVLWSKTIIKIHFPTVPLQSWVSYRSFCVWSGSHLRLDWNQRFPVADVHPVITSRKFHKNLFSRSCDILLADTQKHAHINARKNKNNRNNIENLKTVTSRKFLVKLIITCSYISFFIFPFAPTQIPVLLSSTQIKKRDYRALHLEVQDLFHNLWFNRKKKEKQIKWITEVTFKLIFSHIIVQKCFTNR